MKCVKCGGTLNKVGGCNLCEMFATGATPGGTQTTGWPKRSAALAVHKKQVEAANARNKRNGVNVVYDPANGDAIIPDRNERKKLCKVEGFHDNLGGYGDA